MNYLDRLAADFDRLFPPIKPPVDPVVLTEASEGICALEEETDE